MGPNGGLFHVVRGGEWDGDAALCRAASRSIGVRTFREFSFGFRLALSPSGGTPVASKGK
jgi:formylglycine-generating enzyme required for sulfatase activity